MPVMRHLPHGFVRPSLRVYPTPGAVPFKLGGHFPTTAIRVLERNGTINITAFKSYATRYAIEVMTSLFIRRLNFEYLIL